MDWNSRRSTAILENALKSSHESGELWNRGELFARRAVTATAQGKLDKAEVYVERALEAATPAERLLAMSGRDPRRENGLVHGHLDGLDGRATLRAIEALAGGLHGDPLAETLYLDAQLALVDDMLHYFDRTSMAHSLEVRVPFLDHEVVEFCATIPTRLKVRRLNTKHILKESARGIVPDQPKVRTPRLSASTTRLLR